MTFPEKLTKHHIIFLDTAPIIYYIEAHPQFGALAKDVVDAFQSGTLRAFSSVLTLAEVLPKPVETGNTALADQFTAFLRRGKHIRLVEISVDIAESAGKLRGKILQYGQQCQSGTLSHETNRATCQAFVADAQHLWRTVRGLPGGTPGRNRRRTRR